GHKFAATSTDNYFPTGSGATITVAGFPNAFSNGNYYKGAYKRGSNPAFTAVNNAFTADLAANPANYSLIHDVSSQFDLIEKVSAGYLMNTLDFSKVRLVAGVRFEGTNLSTAAPDVDPNGVFLG